MSVVSSRSYTRLPSASKAVKLLDMRDSDDAALEFYELWNSAWRTQYMNPVIACRGIGTESSPVKYKLGPDSSESMQDDDAENLINGITTLGSVQDPFQLIDYLTEYIDSDDENLMQYLA